MEEEEEKRERGRKKETMDGVNTSYTHVHVHMQGSVFSAVEEQHELPLCPSLVAKLRGTEQEASPQHTHGRCHGNGVKVLDPYFRHLQRNKRREM